MTGVDGRRDAAGPAPRRGPIERTAADAPSGPGRIGACLIVRDEHDRLRACLDSLDGLVDELVVCDTGSSDDSIEIATRAGALVVNHRWSDDFAAARNAALAACTASWVLSVDADETVEADTIALRQLVAAAEDITAFSVEIDHGAIDGRGLAAHRELKLFRPNALVWRGRVHEQLVDVDGRRPTYGVAPLRTISYTHHGYHDEAAVIAKSRRNARLCALQLDDLAAVGGPVEEIARTALDLGRSYLGCGESAAAIPAFSLVRKICADGPEWRWATDFLVHLALSTGQHLDALALVDELAAADAPAEYCAWLRALGKTALGDRDGARLELASVGDLVDLAGRPLARTRVEELTALLDPS